MEEVVKVIESINCVTQHRVDKVEILVLLKGMLCLFGRKLLWLLIFKTNKKSGSSLNDKLFVFTLMNKPKKTLKIYFTA